MARPFRLARSSAFLGIAHLTEAALPFVRNVTIARLMEPREFALSLTLSTIVAIVELVTDVGIPQLAVKLDARAVRARNTLHTIAAGRAIGVGLIVALLAEPLARLFGAPGAAWAFALTGLSIAVKGFANLGVKQMGRDYRFGAEAIVIVVSQVIWTTAVVVLSFIWSDHRAMVAGLLFYSAGFVIGSQFLSPVRYGLAWDKAVVTEAMRFGRPLVPNGIALAITSLGDRIAVGSKLSLEALALYGPLTTTAILPRGVALRYVNNLFLPAMVRTVEQNGDRAPPMRAWIAVISLMAVFFGLGFMCVAEPVIRLVFGARYTPTPLLTSLMGMLLVCRILVTYPVPLAVATNRTWFIAGSSFVSAASLFPATLSLFMNHSSLTNGLAWFLGVMAVVETLGPQSFS